MIDTPNNRRAVVQRLLDDPAFLYIAVEAENAGLIPTVVGDELIFYTGGSELEGWELDSGKRNGEDDYRDQSV